MRIHPAAKMIPEMSEAEFNSLVADIRDKGCLLHPIELLNGSIIDGRHRYRACKEAKVEPEFVEVDLNGFTAMQYVYSVNCERRHLTASQKAAMAVEMLPELEAKAKERQKRKPKSVVEKMPQQNGSKARDEAASIVGVNSRYVSDAKAIKEESPELFKEVKEGKTKLAKAKRQLDRERREAERPKAPPKPKNSQCKIIHGDCIEELPKISGARLIFADPPYNIGIDYGDGKKADKLPDDEYLQWSREWVNLCASALTPNGSFWLMVPHEYAEHFAVMMNEAGLHRRAWITWYESFGVNCQNNFNRTSRHIFYYVVSPKKFVFHPEAVTRPSDRQEKYNDPRADDGGKIWDDVWKIPRLVGTSKERIDGFPTQLPEALIEPIIGCASNAGDLVVDPFSGSGTTGVVAKRLGRKFTGIEKGELFWEKASIRLHSE